MILLKYTKKGDHFLYSISWLVFIFIPRMPPRGHVKYVALIKLSCSIRSATSDICCVISPLKYLGFFSCCYI